MSARILVRSLLVVVLLFPLPSFAQTRARAVRAAPPDANSPASWLGNNAIVISSPESATDAELAPVLGWIGSSRIVGLGDGTHGTHEFYAIKRQMIEALVRAGGVRAILFEASWPEFNRLNDYVLGRSQEDPESPLKDDLYFFWNTEEIVALVRWIRQWNEANAQAHVEIRGIDVVIHERLINDVLQLLDNVDAAAATSARTAFGCLTSDYYQRIEQWKRDCRASLSAVAQGIENRAADYAARVGTSRYQDVLQSARLMLEAETIEAAGGGAARDQVMARNVTGLQENIGGRVIVWSHNLHTRTSANIFNSVEFASMGSELRARHGNDYFAIGTATYSGQFHSILCATLPSVLVARSIPPLGEQYYEHFLQRSGAPALAIPLRGIGATWLDQRRLLWAAGSCVFADPRDDRATLIQNLVLPQSFDAIFFIDETSPLRVLPNH